MSFLAPVWTIGQYQCQHVPPLSLTGPIGAFDSAVHISEEATNSRTGVPFAIVTSVVTAGVLGWAINMVLAFNMGTDLEGILASPIGQPLATVSYVLRHCNVSLTADVLS